MAIVDGSGNYILRNREGKLVLPESAYSQPQISMPNVVVNPVPPLDMSKKLRDDQSQKWQNQTTGTFGVSDRSYVARDPLETLMGLEQLRELSPPGLKAQGKLVKDMEGGLGAILKGFQDSPISAMKLGGVARGLDQIYGTNLKDIISDTTHNLAMNIPELAKMVSNERAKYSQLEQSYLNKIMSDFVQKKNNQTDMQIITLANGLMAKNPSLSPSAAFNMSDKIYTRTKEFLDTYYDPNLRDHINSAVTILNRYSPEESPMGASSWTDTLETYKNKLANATINSKEKAAKVKQYEEDKNTLQSAIDFLVTNEGANIKGVLSDQDVERQYNQLSQGWARANNVVRRKLLKSFIDAVQEKFRKGWNNLTPQYKSYIRENHGTDVETLYSQTPKLNMGKKKEFPTPTGKLPDTVPDGVDVDAIDIEEDF